MRIILIAVAAASLLSVAAPAAAQINQQSNGGFEMPGIDISGGKQADPETLEKRKEVERAYRDATQKIPAQQTGSPDPWANMRGVDEVRPKPVAKPQHSAQKKKPVAQ